MSDPTDHVPAVIEDAQELPISRPIPSNLAIMLPPAYIARPDKLWALKAKYPDAPDQKIAEVAIRADSMGIDPLVTPIYIIRRESKTSGTTWTLQASIDAFRAVAASEVIVGHRPNDYAYDKAGNLLMATVWGKKFSHGEWHEVCASALWPEYVQTDRGGAPTDMWARMAHNQLSKCAESLLLRRACPSKLAGLYSTDEMAQAGNIIDVEVKKSAPAKVATPAATPKAEPSPVAPEDQTRLETVKVTTSEHVTTGKVTREVFSVHCESGNIYKTTSTGLAAMARTFKLQAAPVLVTFTDHGSKGLGLKAIKAAPAQPADGMDPQDELWARAEKAMTAGEVQSYREILAEPTATEADWQGFAANIVKAESAAAAGL